MGLRTATVELKKKIVLSYMLTVCLQPFTKTDRINNFLALRFLD